MNQKLYTHTHTHTHTPQTKLECYLTLKLLLKTKYNKLVSVCVTLSKIHLELELIRPYDVYARLILSRNEKLQASTQYHQVTVISPGDNIVLIPSFIYMIII